MFDFGPLDDEDAHRIDSLLSENAKSDVTNERQLQEDARNLKDVSAQIKAIGKQGTVLIGERVYKAREILKPYRDGTFSKWLELTFGSRKTGYNMLAYYELSRALPDEDLRKQFKQIAQRPAYILASRTGDMDKKIEIIRKAKGLNPNELVTLIQNAFPKALGDKRSGESLNGPAIDSIRRSLQKLYKNKDALIQNDMDELQSLKRLLDSLVSEQCVTVTHSK